MFKAHNFIIFLMVLVFYFNGYQCYALTAPILKKQQVNFTPKHGGDKIVLEFDGSIWTKASGIKVNSNVSDPLGKFIYKIVAGGANGDATEILNTWAPEEQEKIKKMMSDPRAFKNNKAFYNNILSSEIVGIIKYGNFYLTFILHDVRGIGDYLKLYPVLIISDRYYLSNALEGDFFYANMIDNLGVYMWPK